MTVTLEEYVLTGGDCGPYQKFLAIMSSLTYCMHTFCLTLEVFTALTPTATFTDTGEPADLQSICKTEGPGIRAWKWDNPDLSIISEFNLICGEAYKARIVSLLTFVGYTVGCVFWGWLGDRIGRVPSLHTCQFLNSILLYLTSITPSYGWYCVVRILTGFTACHWNTACVYSTEWGGRANRTFTLMTHIVLSSLGFALFGTIAYFIRPWRRLIRALSIFGGVVFVLLIPALKESPRWLFCNGRKEEAVANIQFAARMNRLAIIQVIDVENDIIISKSLSTTTGPESVRLLLRRPRLVFITATFYLTSLANVLIYYMLKFNAENLSPSPYLSCWLLSLADLPSVALIYCFSDFKRRLVNFWVQVVAVTFCLMCCIPQVRLASAMLCMAFAAISFNYVYLYLAEVYPTTIRNRVTACCIAVAEIGGMASNPLIMTNGMWDALPFLVAAVVAIGPTIASWWLPETKGHCLPDRIIDTLPIVYPPEELCLINSKDFKKY